MLLLRALVQYLFNCAWLQTTEVIKICKSVFSSVRGSSRTTLALGILSLVFLSAPACLVGWVFFGFFQTKRTVEWEKMSVLL